MALSRTAINCARRPSESMAPLLIKRFQHALVEQPQIHILAEFINRLNRPSFFRAATIDSIALRPTFFTAARPKRIAAAMRREVGVGHIDVRRFDGNAHLAAFVDVLDHVIGAAGDRSQQRGHKLDRIMRLEIRRVIGEQRISGRVRFVETVAGKLRHQIENLFDFLRRITCAAPRLRQSARAAAAISSAFFLPMARRSRSASPRE